MWLALVHGYWIIGNETGPRGPWRVQTSGYSYILHAEGGHELLAFQWHPIGPSAVTTPHVHLSYGLGIQRTEFMGIHVPTGRVAAEDVLRMLIRDLSIKARRADWEAVLEDTQSKFVEWRSWG